MLVSHTTGPATLLLAGALALGGCMSAAQVPAASQPGPMTSATRSTSDMLAAWPQKQRETASEMMGKYGQPDVMSDHMIAWFNKGPFVKTVIMRQEVPHNFPMAHVDYLTQTVKHRVPADKVDELFEYDGSVYVHRTRGEITAQCDVEAMNFLALNLAHDVAMGRRTVADARAFYARTAMAFKNGDRSSPYVMGLTFQQESNAADPDRPAQM